MDGQLISIPVGLFALSPSGLVGSYNLCIFRGIKFLRPDADKRVNGVTEWKVLQLVFEVNQNMTHFTVAPKTIRLFLANRTMQFAVP